MNTTFKKIAIVIINIFIISLCYTQPGANDPTFNPSDVGFTLHGGILNNGIIQADGKIIISGAFLYNGEVQRLTCLNEDGSLDNSFVSGTGANNNIRSTAIQSDGKIIVAGDFDAYNDITINRIARLNSDGILDIGFDSGTGANGDIYKAIIQPDGKIIIGGGFTSFNGTSVNHIARLNSDGTLDTGFEIGVGANDIVETISAQTDGKIIIGGSFTSYNDSTTNRIARLNTDGSLDDSFDSGLGANNRVQTINIQSDSKIIVGGNFTSFNGTTKRRIVRLNTDGSIDASFDTGLGVGAGHANAYVSFTIIQSDGKIVVGGHFNNYDTTSTPTSVNIIRINTDSSIDTTFNAGTDGASHHLYASAVQPDDKIIIGGNFSFYNNISRNCIARLNVDGTLDTSFNPGTGTGSHHNRYIRVIAVQPDGKIIVGGSFLYFNGESKNRIVRLNEDGSIDNSFNIGTGLGTNPNTLLNAISIQSDGKIIIGGSFDSYNNVPRNGIARLNPDGSLDNTFNPATGANARINSIAIQSDGKILITERYTPFSGGSTNLVSRLNTDGSIDTSFNIGEGFNSIVRNILIQPDGKVIVSGSFTSYNDTPTSRIVRLNTDGSIDNDFNPGSGVNGSIFTSYLQPDGKVIIGGYFDSYNGEPRNNFARINTDGSLDTNFNVGSGSGWSFFVYTSSIQSDGKIIIGGEFTSYDGKGRNRVARVLVDDPIWSGSENNDWDNTNNWEALVIPRVTDNIIIPNNPIGGNFPEISSNIEINSLTIENQSELLLNLGYSITLNDTLINEGVIKSTPGNFIEIDDSGENIVITAVSCPAGSYCPNGIDVIACAPGTSQSLTGQSECIACEPGTFSDTEGQLECMECPEGMEQPLSGQEGCVALTSISSLENGAVKLYPNPAQNETVLVLENNHKYEYLELVNIGGKVLNRQQITNGNTTIKINLSALSAGVYLIKVNGLEYQTVKKLIKQ